jgi:Protein of unknown function (DUF3226)
MRGVAAKRESFCKPCVLAVEGKDQYYLLRSFAAWHGLCHAVQAVCFEGTSQLRGFLAALPEVTGFDGVTALGVIRDAEEEREGQPVTAAEAAIQSVSDAFRDVLRVTGPGRHGEVAVAEMQGRQVRVGAFISPDGVSPGMLEDLCLQPAERRQPEVMACVDAYLDCLRSKTPVERPNWPKRRLHAYLAACEQPGLKLGEAGAAGCWHFDDAAWDPLKRFLRDLASD